MFTICLCVFLFSSIELFNIYKEYKQGTDIYQEASTNVSLDEDGNLDPNNVISNEEIEDNPQYEIKEVVSLDVDWNKFNDKVIGWISMKNNDVVNYPIIQSYDNEYYLHHLYDGTYNSAGSIFVDYRNDGFENKHTIIYGHNMKNGSMFSSIKKYQNQEYADEHRYIYIATPDGITRTFYIYSCHITDALGEKNGFNAYTITFNGDEWDNWIKETQNKSLIKSDIEIPTNCNIITLSTCMSRGVETERCVIHAVEISNKQLIKK